MPTFSPFIRATCLGLSFLACTSCGNGTADDDAHGGSPAGGNKTGSGGAPGSGGNEGLSGGAPGSGGTGGQSPSARRPCRTLVETDLQGDGSINETHELDYDDAGNLAKDVADLSIPYDIEVTTDYTYNDAGNVLTKLEDRSDKPPSLSTYHYRDDGQLDLIEEDVGADGSVEGTDDYVYGPDSRLAEVELAFEGSTTIVCQAIWLGEREVRLDCDEGDDGSVEQSSRRLRNERGQLLEFEVYSPNDGSSLTLDTYSYSDAGDLLQIAKDAPGGDPFSVVTHTYDDERNLVSVEEVAEDGSIFSYSTYKHTFECD